MVVVESVGMKTFEKVLTKKKIENLWKGVLVYFKINGLIFNWMGKKY